MWNALAGLVMAAGLSLAPGAAREPTKEDSAAIEQCVVDAKNDPYACLGLVEKPCQDTEAGQTTYGAMLCADRETVVWSQRAKASADAITAKLEPARLKLFKAADDAWVKYRNAACAYESSIYLGGSLAKVVAADCMLRETADRALDLADDEKSSVNGE